MAAEGVARPRTLGNGPSASMGPRPVGRGRTGDVSWDEIIKTKRQWGRDRLAAEGRRGGRLTRTVVASMGPRPVGRGRLPTSSAKSPARSRVNGAATGWPRKADRCRRKGRGSPASMGPRPVGRGRGGGGSFTWFRWFSVNGAATGWPRKASYAVQVQSMMCSRQWGRDRLAAEGCGRRGGPRLQKASMGPRPVGRGRSTGRPGSRRPASVNGAATGWPRKASRAALRAASSTARQWGRDRLAAEGAQPQG